jgi:hypothetical protein
VEIKNLSERQQRQSLLIITLFLFVERRER